MSTLVLALCLIMVAGILNGRFATPMKYARLWTWENIWSVWAVVGFFLFPWFMVWLTVPHALAIYGGDGIQPLLLVIGCGVGVGLAQIFFGLGIAALGIALNFAIAIGLSTVLGSIVPLVAKHREMILTTKGMVILAGVVFVLVGIVFCAVAGKHKETNLQNSAGEPQEGSAKKMSFKTGLILCVLAGIGSPFQNFGLVYGDTLMARAAQMGVALSNRTNVIWAPMLTAALLPYMIYCVYRLKKNKSAHLYCQSGTALYWVFGAIMGVLWFGSTIIYGAVTTMMGTLGPVLGWPLFMSAIIIVSNVWGFITGEWKNAGGKALSRMLVGIMFLILGFVALAISGSLA